MIVHSPLEDWLMATTITIYFTFFLMSYIYCDICWLLRSLYTCINMFCWNIYQGKLPWEHTLANCWECLAFDGEIYFISHHWCYIMTSNNRTHLWCTESKLFIIQQVLSTILQKDCGITNISAGKQRSNCIKKCVTIQEYFDGSVSM